MTDAETDALTGSGLAAETGVQDPAAGGLITSLREQIEKESVPGGCAPVPDKNESPKAPAIAPNTKPARKNRIQPSFGVQIVAGC